MNIRFLVFQHVLFLEFEDGDYIHVAHRPRFSGDVGVMYGRGYVRVSMVPSVKPSNRTTCPL